MNHRSHRLPFLRRLVVTAAWCISAFSRVPVATSAEPSPSLPIPAPADVLKTLRPEHPRLFAAKAEFERLRKAAQEDPLRRGWWTKIRTEADRTLTAPVVKYDIPDGLRLLNVSRRVVERAYMLGLAWQLTGEKKYTERLARELEAVMAFPDWNPRHFLDTAEMCHGVGLAYDWCFDAWTAEQRAAFRTGLVEKGLKPALAAYQDESAPGGWWPRARHNWNQVCNAGVLLGALAIADEAAGPAGEVVSAAARSIQRAMAEFAPDGGWAEGPSYWNYATIYNVAGLAGLDSALGTDFGLAALPGFSETGLFPLHVTGPRGRTFNFADGRDGELHAPHLFWLARKFQRPRYAIEQLDNVSPHPLDLVWYDPALASAKLAPEPLDKHFRGVEVVTLRSAWDTNSGAVFGGTRALFVGFKGGDNQANHSHLDLGSFVLDALGQRWATDLGPENYSVPGYFGKERWDYYLTRAEGHNTLVLNPGAGPDQDPNAKAPIVAFASHPDESFAVADLTAAYAKDAKRVRRGISLRAKRTEVLVQDEIEAERPAEVWWFFHTAAKVEANGREAILSFGNNRLIATLLGAAEAAFEIRPATPLPSSPKPVSQSPASVRCLALHLKDVKDARFAVRFVPVPAGQERPANGDHSPLVPLAEWK